MDECFSFNLSVAKPTTKISLISEQRLTIFDFRSFKQIANRYSLILVRKSCPKKQEFNRGYYAAIAR